MSVAKEKTGHRVAVIRCSEWDITQAGPRVVNTLMAQGCEVTVLCWDFSQKKPLKEMRDGFRIIRFKHRMGRYSSLKYLLSWLLWWFWIAKTCLSERFDFVHVMNFESVVPVVLIKRMAKHCIVYDIRDPWGMATSAMPWPVPQIFSLLDRIFSTRVDGMLLSQGRLSQCAEYFGKVTSAKIPTVQVLNVPYKDMLSAPKPPPVNPLRINFSGHISWERNLSVVLEACRHDSNVHLDLVGELRDPEIAKAVDGLQNVSAFGRVPFVRAMALLHEASLVCVMYDTNTRIAQVASANKMFESMMMARPYVASSNGYPADMAEQFEVGWSLSYGDTHAFQGLIERLLADPVAIEERGKRGRQLYRSRFQWKDQERNLLDLYAHLSGRPKRCSSVKGWQCFIGNTT